MVSFHIIWEKGTSLLVGVHAVSTEGGVTAKPYLCVLLMPGARACHSFAPWKSGHDTYFDTRQRDALVARLTPTPKSGRSRYPLEKGMQMNEFWPMYNAIYSWSPYLTQKT